MSSSNRHKNIVTAAVILLATCLLTILAVPALAVLLVDDVARSLLPPAYPGSELVRVSDFVASPHVRLEESVYHTADDTLDVLRYMQEQMPGFVRSNNVLLYNCFQNERKLQGVPYRIAKLNYLPTPAAQVTICPARRGGTMIHMGTVWPEP